MGVVNGTAKWALLVILSAAVAWSADFAIEIGSPVAAGSAVKIKGAVFSVRTRGCANPAGVQFSGRAVTGAESVPLRFYTGSPGTFAVALNNRQSGVWLAAITATCGASTAGLLLPVDASGAYNRAAARFLPHTPTEAEIQAARSALKMAK